MCTYTLINIPYISRNFGSIRIGFQMARNASSEMKSLQSNMHSKNNTKCYEQKLCKIATNSMAEELTKSAREACKKAKCKEERFREYISTREIENEKVMKV